MYVEEVFSGFFYTAILDPPVWCDIFKHLKMFDHAKMWKALKGEIGKNIIFEDMYILFPLTCT